MLTQSSQATPDADHVAASRKLPAIKRVVDWAPNLNMLHFDLMSLVGSSSRWHLLLAVRGYDSRSLLPRVATFGKPASPWQPTSKCKVAVLRFRLTRCKRVASRSAGLLAQNNSVRHSSQGPSVFQVKGGAVLAPSIC